MNSYGNKFRISVFGESHGQMIGVVIDGTPAGIPLSADDFLEDLERRKSGRKGTTTRYEDDFPEIMSGVSGGHTTGAPICIIFRNSNARSKDYSTFRDVPRPGHADFAAYKKFHGFNDIKGGGHFSGRLTLTLVAAGVIAKKIISPISIEARLTKLGGEPADWESGVSNVITGVKGVERLPYNWDRILDRAIMDGDSVGGIIECCCNNVPVGLGEPFFDSLESQISHLAFSVPAVRGIEFGDGFAAAAMRGSEHNDPFIDKEGHTAKNGAGGINGGISNGNPILFRVAIKPTSSIAKPQQTYNFATDKIADFSAPGRHDACIALRCPVILESVAAIVLANNIYEGV